MRRARTPLRSSLVPRLLAAVAVSTLLSTVAACSGTSDQAGGSSSASSAPASPTVSSGSSTAPESPSSSGSASSSSSAGSGASPSEGGSTPAGTPSELPTVRRRATNLHVAILESSVARTAEEKAVVKAWIAYWQAATDSTYLGREVRALATVSTGQARSSIQALVRQNTANGQRGVGWAEDNVTRVTVTGDRATVRDCTRNFTFNVDEEGTPASRPFPWYDARGRLEKRAGSWVVVRADSPSREKSCLG